MGQIIAVDEGNVMPSQKLPDIEFDQTIRRIIEDQQIKGNELVLRVNNFRGLFLIHRGCYFAWTYPGKKTFIKKIPVKQFIALGLIKVDKQKLEIRCIIPENAIGFGIKYIFRPERSFNLEYESKEPEVLFNLPVKQVD